jgi:hypothetical protein
MSEWTVQGKNCWCFRCIIYFTEGSLGGSYTPFSQNRGGFVVWLSVYPWLQVLLKPERRVINDVYMQNA